MAAVRTSPRPGGPGCRRADAGLGPGGRQDTCLRRGRRRAEHRGGAPHAVPVLAGRLRHVLPGGPGGDGRRDHPQPRRDGHRRLPRQERHRRQRLSGRAGQRAGRHHRGRHERRRLRQPPAPAGRLAVHARLPAVPQPDDRGGHQQGLPVQRHGARPRRRRPARRRHQLRQRRRPDVHPARRPHAGRAHDRRGRPRGAGERPGLPVPEPRLGRPHGARRRPGRRHDPHRQPACRARRPAHEHRHLPARLRRDAEGAAPGTARGCSSPPTTRWTGRCPPRV